MRVAPALLLLLGLLPIVGNASPCDGINRTLSDQDRIWFTQAIARQTGAQKVDIQDYFSSGSWRIIYAADYISDDPFLFYSKSPLVQHYITLWSGAAVIDETPDIEKWTLQHAPGIPRRLAACFAWYVTKDERK